MASKILLNFVKYIVLQELIVMTFFGNSAKKEFKLCGKINAKKKH